MSRLEDGIPFNPNTDVHSLALGANAKKGRPCRVVDGRHVSRAFAVFVGLCDVVKFQEDLPGRRYSMELTQGRNSGPAV